MNATEILAGAALGVSGLALYLSLLAAWPQVKEWAESMRDLVLWVALLAVIGGIGYFGWMNYEAGRNRPASTTMTSQLEPTAPGWEQ